MPGIKHKRWLCAPIKTGPNNNQWHRSRSGQHKITRNSVSSQGKRMILASSNEHCDVIVLVSQCIRNGWVGDVWIKSVLTENSSNGNKGGSRTKTKSFPLTWILTNPVILKCRNLTVCRYLAFRLITWILKFQIRLITQKLRRLPNRRQHVRISNWAVFSKHTRGPTKRLWCPAQCQHQFFPPILQILP